MRVTDPWDAEIVVGLVEPEVLIDSDGAANGISGGPTYAGRPDGFVNPDFNLRLAAYGQAYTYLSNFNYFDTFNGLPFRVNVEKQGTLLHELGHALGLKHPHDSDRAITRY